MNLWIRSQNKELLMQVKYLHINAYGEKNKDVRIYSYGYEDFSYLLGTYKTKERALEILDEIQELLEPVHITDISKKEGIVGANIFYEMPKE